ncbi:MAG: hypothetical protein ACRDQ4_14755 [Pseudonocardiaceae bacterium]
MGQKLAIKNTGQGTLFLAALIIVAQLVMIPMSILVGRRADRWGHKMIFLAAFSALPLRGVLFTLSNNALYLVSVQVLAGIAFLALLIFSFAMPETRTVDGVMCDIP